MSSQTGAGEIDPARYKPDREEDKQSFAWLPFGAGRHRCVGAAFAMMQLKAIFSVLLREYDFEMAQPAPRRKITMGRANVLSRFIAN